MGLTPGSKPLHVEKRPEPVVPQPVPEREPTPVPSREPVKVPA